MRTFASLKFFNYRLWFAGALVSNVGTWMQRIAQDWLVLTVLTHNSGAQVGIVTALQFVPFLIIGPYAGVLTDRVNNRKLLIATQSAAGALGLALGVMVLTNTAQLWHVYMFATLLGVVYGLRQPGAPDLRHRVGAREQPGQRRSAQLRKFQRRAAHWTRCCGSAHRLVGASAGCSSSTGFTFGATIVASCHHAQCELNEHERAPRARARCVRASGTCDRRADLLVIMAIMAVVSVARAQLPTHQRAHGTCGVWQGRGRVRRSGLDPRDRFARGSALVARRRVPDCA